jgi:hypothetical protein
MSAILHLKIAGIPFSGIDVKYYSVKLAIVVTTSCLKANTSHLLANWT